MEYKNITQGNGGIIELWDAQENIGRLTYTLVPEEKKMIISYVMVFPKFEGKGMGKYLVQEGISFAREKGFTVYPHCSYARSVMKRMPDIQDVFLEG